MLPSEHTSQFHCNYNMGMHDCTNTEVTESYSNFAMPATPFPLCLVQMTI